MNTDWNAAIAFVLKEEGGYTNDPNDSGGETMFGIARNFQPTWSGWAIVDARKTAPNFPENINTDSGLLESAKDFYRSNFWQSCHCDELPSPLAIAVFDGAVNQGDKTAIKMLQIALNVTVDGIIGDQTITAAFKAGPKIVRQFLAQRMVRYIRIIVKTPAKQMYADLWSSRLMRLAELTLKSATPVA